MLNPKVRLRASHQHSQFWLILARFMDYYSLFWGPRVISTINKPCDAFTCWSSTLAVLADSGPFLRLLIFFGVSESFPRLTNPGVRLCVGHQHSHIRPILFRFVHYYSAFWGPEAISTIDEPRVRLCVCRQHSQFCPILTSFVDYYSPFWGPEAISMVVKPQGALTCLSSTIAVWADSGPFLGLLLSFGVPK